MKILLVILLWTSVGTMSLAGVDLRTNIQDLFYRGTCEEAASITMSVNGNDFASASVTDPIFIRVRLDHEAVLCSSLVGSWGTQSNGFMGQPIYLAMRMGKSEPASNNTIAAAPETVSIVRWIEGENAIWLRVQSSSNDWIYNTATSQTEPPSPINGPVAWTFGITAAISVENNALLNANLAGSTNLPANTRDPSYTNCGPGVYPNYIAISTLICVDLEDATLEVSPNPESILKFDTFSFRDTAWSGDFGVFTAMPGVAIDTGSPSTPSYSGDDSIARGMAGTCTATIYNSSPEYASLCLAAVGQSEDSLVLMENELTINVEYDAGFNRWSVFDLYNANGGPWGFPVKVDTANGELIGDLYSSYYGVYNPGVLGTESYFVGGHTNVDFLGPLKNRGDYYFADEMYMFYAGTGMTGTSNTVVINVEVGQIYADAPGDVQIGVALFVSNKDSRWEGSYPAFGVGPCDIDAFANSPNYMFANDYCPPTYRLAMHTIWEHGGFVEFLPGIIETSPSIAIAQGIYYLLLSANGDFPCMPEPSTIQWENVTDGIVYGVNHNPLQLSSLLTKTTVFRVTASDDSGILSVKDITILVPINSGFTDINGDMCNDVNDLHILASEWQTPYFGDPNNDGFLNILDLMYINVSGICVINGK